MTKGDSTRKYRPLEVVALLLISAAAFPKLPNHRIRRLRELLAPRPAQRGRNRMEIRDFLMSGVSL